MMEAVRRSVGEEGYRLALPEDLGHHNGISNEAVTRSFIDQSITTNESERILSFRTHPHSYKFQNAFSRADHGLPMREVLPLSDREGIQYAQGNIDLPWNAIDFDIQEMVEESIALKNGQIEDQLRYIPSLQGVEKAGLKGDPDFTKTLYKWLADSSVPFKLRKQVLLHEWTQSRKSLDELLGYFSETEQIGLLQNLLDTPRFSKLIFQNTKELPSLILRAKGNIKVRSKLISGYSPKNENLISIVIDANDLDSQKMIKTISAIKTHIDSNNILDLAKVLDPLQGTSIFDEGMDIVGKHFLNTNNRLKIARELSSSLEADSEVVRKLSLKILENSDDPKYKDITILKIYKEFSRRQALSPSESLDQIAKSWLRDTSVNPDLKADFFETFLGAKTGKFKSDLELVPESHKTIIWKRLDNKGALSIFRSFARNLGIEDSLLDQGIGESFEFASKDFPKAAPNGGKTFRMGFNPTLEVNLTEAIEMQITPVTQLQWTLVMGENPSRFTDEGIEVLIKGRKVKVDPNRPVERISWEDVQKFIQKLNESQDEFTYRLPTEAEWEFAARGGTTTTYSFGDDADLIGSYAWSGKNSGFKTQPVAELLPNPYGLYDIHGNVSEWTGALPYTDSVTNPRAAESGAFRVIRGGSWSSSPRDLRPTWRGATFPGDRRDQLGFRLVRTPK